MPASFVDQQVQFVATATALQEDLAGVGSSAADLQGYFDAHSAKFDTVCFSAAVYLQRERGAGGGGRGGLRDAVLDGGVEHRQQGGGAQGCHLLPELGVQSAVRRRPRQPGHRRRLGAHQRQREVRPAADHLADADAVQPRRRPPWRTSSSRPASTATQKALAADRAPVLGEREPAVRGVGARAARRCSPRFTPAPTDVLNAAANDRRRRVRLGVGLGQPDRAADRAAAPPPRHGGGPRARRHRSSGRRRRRTAALAAPGRAYLRTARHPAAARFEGVPAFDDLYEAAATFDEVYAGIVEALVAAAIRGGARAGRLRRAGVAARWPSAASSCCAPTAGSR